VAPRHYFYEAEMETINKDNRLKLVNTDSKRAKRYVHSWICNMSCVECAAAMNVGYIFKKVLNLLGLPLMFLISFSILV
jgi:hypothetical protein